MIWYSYKSREKCFLNYKQIFSEWLSNIKSYEQSALKSHEINIYNPTIIATHKKRRKTNKNFFNFFSLLRN